MSVFHGYRVYAVRGRVGTKTRGMGAALFIATPVLGVVRELIEVVSRETAVEADDKTCAGAALLHNRNALNPTVNFLAPVIRRVVP